MMKQMLLIKHLFFFMKLFKRILTIALSFVLVFNAFLNISFPVFASGFSPSEEFQFPSDWNEYTSNQKKYFMTHDPDFLKLSPESQIYYIDRYRVLTVGVLSNLEDLLMYLATNKLGVVAKNGSKGLKDAWTGAVEQAYADDIDVVTQNSNGEVYLSDAYLSIFNEFLNEFVDANSPKYRIIDTMDLRTVSATQYKTKDQWEKAKALLSAHSNDLVCMSSETVSGFSQICFYVVDCSDIAFFVKQGRDYVYGILPYDNDWTTFPFSNWGYDTSWDCVSKYIWNTSENNFTKAETCTFTPNNFVRMFAIGTYNTQGGTYLSPAQFSYKNGKAITVFEKREDAVNWITGQRDVYTTSSFGSYQSGNSIRISGDTLTNSGNTYTTVNNIVNNYYENNNGGYTEAEIQDMIDKAVEEALKGSGGNGSGGGDTNITVSGGDSGGGSSGGGLGGFLSGLGKLLDGVLAILGKLLEYIGKAIQLFVDTIGKVLDIVPKAFSEFLAAVFPFFPTEIFTAIELILALSVVLMVIKMFKK